RLVAGDLQALHVRGEVRRAVANLRGRAPSSFGKKVPRAFAGGNLLQRCQQGRRVSKSKIGGVDESFLSAFHRKGDGGAGRKGVGPRGGQQRRGFQDGFRVRDAAERAEGEQALVFQPYSGAVFCRVDVLAADRTRGA